MKRTHLLFLAVFGTILICGGWLVSDLSIEWQNALYWIQQLKDLGWIGIVCFICFSAIAIVISPIPSTPVTLAAGTVWGPLQAGLYAVIGIYIGSLLAYLIGRTWGRSIVKVLTGKAIYLSKDKGESYLSWIIMLAHLLPVVPYDLFSYGAGVSGLSFRWFAISCFLGITPSTLLLTHAGAAMTLNLTTTTLILVTLILGFGLMSWGVRRHNWFGLNDVISFH